MKCINEDYENTWGSGWDDLEIKYMAPFKYFYNIGIYTLNSEIAYDHSDPYPLRNKLYDIVLL